MTYSNLRSAQPTFRALMAKIHRITPTFQSSFTTPMKVDEAYRLLQEAEDLCTELRVRMK